MTQYSKRMVIAHWLTLLLLIAAWFIGHELDEARHEDVGASLAGYAVHILIGASVLLVAVARLFFRSKDGAPPPMGSMLMDKAAKGIHLNARLCI